MLYVIFLLELCKGSLKSWKEEIQSIKYPSMVYRRMKSSLSHGNFVNRVLIIPA